MLLLIKSELGALVELFKGLRTIGHDWHNKTPLQKWCYLRNVGKIGFGLVGIPLYRDDQTLYPYSYFACMYVGLYVSLVVYTACFYISHGEFMKFLPSTCLLIGPVLAYIPLLSQLLSKNRHKLHNFVEFPGRYIYRDDNRNTAYNRICTEQMDLSMRKFLIKIILLSIGGSGGFLSSLYSSFVLDVKTTTIELKFPFVAEKSTTEFSLNMMMQFIIFFHGIFIYFGIEITMTIFENFTAVSTKWIQNEIFRLNDNNEHTEMSQTQRRFLFRNILLQSCDCDSYMMNIRDFLYWRTFTIPFLYSYSIGMSIFCQFTMKFAAGYGMAWMSYTQLFFVCETGDTIENNGLDEIWNEMDWYDLPTELQKDVMHLINRMQNGVKLTVGPLGSVNREFFKFATKNIYSFIMFLLNFGS